MRIASTLKPILALTTLAAGVHSYTLLDRVNQKGKQAILEPSKELKNLKSIEGKASNSFYENEEAVRAMLMFITICK